MKHIRTSTCGKGKFFVTVSNKNEEYRFLFVDGERGRAEKLIKYERTVSFYRPSHRFVKGPEKLWSFASNFASEEYCNL